MDKRAQGLPITTIILAILGLVILVILFAITTGRLAIFGRGISECPGECVGQYTGQISDQNFNTQNRQCTPQFEKELVGAYIRGGQTGVKPEDIVKCAHCCIPLA